MSSHFLHPDWRRAVTVRHVGSSNTQWRRPPSQILDTHLQPVKSKSEEDSKMAARGRKQKATLL
jgi:hypothetical protein